MSGQALKTDPLCPQQHTHPKHSPNRCIFCEYGAAVRADALRVAHDAVAARLASSPWPNSSYNDGLIDALAAIDALKEDK